jgi:penicillin-binding protein 2
MIPTSRNFADRRGLQGRLVVLRIVAIAGCALLAVGFWVLQIVEHDRYLQIADNQHLKTIPLPAPRGVLFDRNNKVLVENTYSFTITVLRDLSTNPDHNVDQTVRLLAAVTGLDEARTLEEVYRHKREPLYRPIPIIEHATIAQVSAVMARQLEMPEVVVQQEPTRRYPAGGMAAHLFGYVGEINQEQLERAEYAGIQPGAVIGQAGLERTYNDLLTGQDGKRDVAVNSKGREIPALAMGEESPPVDGAPLQLTIDYDLQRAVEEAYKANNSAGAAIFLDPRTGEVLAFTSQPEYDPNAFASGLNRAKWNELNADPLKPLQDRLLQGKYSPGSTFKIVMAIAALSEGIITPDFKVYCPGKVTIYDHEFKCDKKEGHGTLDLREAIAQSCDVYFFKVASMMNGHGGIDLIHRYAQQLGLTERTGVDLPGEVAGLVASTEWKQRTKGEKWYPGETISVGIGQGPVSVTPIELAAMIAQVAMGGQPVTPHIVKAVDKGNGWEAVAAPAPKPLFPIKPEVIEPVRDGLWAAVNGNGTAFGARVAGHEVLGKTGTAQVVSTETAKSMAGRGGINIRDNSWFVFYSSRDNPEIAGVVFVEHGGFGAEAAVPIARYVLETYFAKKEGRPLPSLVLTPGVQFTISGAAKAPPPTTPRGDERSEPRSVPDSVGVGPHAPRK